MMETALAVAGTASGVALINKISDAIGWYAAPKQVTRMAEAEATADLVRAKAKAESAGIELSELIQRAELRSAVEQIIEQANLEAVILKALQRLEDSAKPQDMDKDWIKNHFDKCRHISDDEMQEWWAKILAGEANNPGSYSKRAVNILGDLEQPEAQAFSSLCNFVWYLSGTPVPLIYDTNHEIYTNSGVNHTTCTYLAELGLLNYTPPIISHGGVEEGAIASYHHHGITLTEITNRRGLNIGHATFTIAGIQLFGLCDTNPVEGFFEYVLGEWREQGIALTTVDELI